MSLLQYSKREIQGRKCLNEKKTAADDARQHLLNNTHPLNFLSVENNTAFVKLADVGSLVGRSVVGQLVIRWLFWASGNAQNEL